MLIFFIPPVPEGLLTAFYRCCREKRVPDVICDGEYADTGLESETVDIAPDSEKSVSVLRWLRRTCGEEGINDFFTVWASGDTDKNSVLLRYLLLIFRYGAAASQMKARSEVIAFDRLYRQVTYEEQRLKGFIRFRAATSLKIGEGESCKTVYANLLYACYRSGNDIIERLAAYFADRNGGMPFVLHDIGREKAAFCNGTDIVTGSLPGKAELDVTEGENAVADLFRRYFNTVSIDTRKNPRLQRSFLPLRYRDLMTEFEPEHKASDGSLPSLNEGN